jgi:hypothetical protein
MFGIITSVMTPHNNQLDVAATVWQETQKSFTGQNTIFTQGP